MNHGANHGVDHGQPPPVRAFLRRCVLAASVLDDLDVDPDDDGVHLPGCAPLAWADVAATAGPFPRGPLTARSGPPGADDAAPGAAARLRVRQLLLAHRELHRRAVRLVPLAVPRGADRHPGAVWESTAVLGGALDLGPGVVVTHAGRERALPVPAASARATGAAAGLTAAQREHLEAMGSLAAHRLHRDEGARDGGVLRPVGGCDAPTLLAAASLRAHLVTAPGDSAGPVLRAVAVPDRTRGWFDLARVDPAFVVAAWAVTDPADRGLRRPVLVTREEVAPAPTAPDVRGHRGGADAGGALARAVLRL
ncbi:hypothetical protein MO973_29480 [Paenibacillus sp. TRM 82003]|uniref:hypothetical protein n=1 Tax=Kineococcus sp. TRM81007 TaxID=2925831 RepID=UPI001F580A6A|nr:hypothetical protein [Kineococcus sp. TRM81007]MCI2238941.1 hypothetical protein [Kineococcus sp. TRM81007]MCI3924360.1 hypothetical protein [Paenibacillus sp. TRM 82003]